jgi:uncharacterized protein
MSLESLSGDLFDWRLAVAAVVCTGAGVMRGFAGFGSVMVTAPLLGMLFGPVQMVVTVMTMELAISLSLLRGALKDVEWRFVAVMSAGAALAMPFGNLLLTSVDPDLLIRGIAAVVLAFVLLLWSGWRYPGPKRLPITFALGGVSGAMLGATSMGGPPVLAYMLAGRDSATVNRANIIAYFTIIEVVLVSIMLLRGLIGVEAVARGAVLTPAFMLAGYAGARGFRRSSEALYRRIALLALAVIALFGLLH